MKFNWKLALMGLAVLAFVACEKNPKDKDHHDEETEYVKPISATDGSLADWDAVDQNFVFETKCPADAALLGLKSAKVYADEQYIFIQVEPNSDDVTDLDWVPFHIYLNTDNSDETGGYGDQFLDANADVLMEGAVYAEGAPCAYGPAVFYWWGEVGGTGWSWQDPAVEPSAENKWGAIVGEGELAGTTSQFVNGKFEIEILRELVPTNSSWSEDEFGIGFDIQQNWSSVGILPCAAATDENPAGHAAKLQVKIKK